MIIPHQKNFEKLKRKNSGKLFFLSRKQFLNLFELKLNHLRTEKMFLKIFFGTGMLAALLITLSIKLNCWELLDGGFSMLCFFTGFLIFGVGSELKKKNMKQADFSWCAFIIFLGLIIIILSGIQNLKE